MERTDILPALLQQGDQKVDRKDDVSANFIRRHADVTASNTHAQHLLELELYSGLDFGNLVSEVVRVSDGGGELVNLVQNGTNNLGELLDKRICGQKSVILGG